MYKFIIHYLPAPRNLAGIAGSFVICLLLFVFLSSSPVLAKTCNPGAPISWQCAEDQQCGPSGSRQCLGGSLGTVSPPDPIQKFGADIEGASKFLNNLFSLFLVVGVVVAFITLLWGGVHYITAGGDKQATQTAREKITAAIIGLVILFSIYLLLNTLGQFLGIDIGKLTIPTP